MTVKEICTEYSKLGNETLKKQCLNKIKITPYVPVLRKDALADIIARRTVFEYENYIAEDGTTKTRLTENVKVNTFIGYILFCRTVIEEYTNLEIDKEHFDTDYDALKTSGLLNILMGGENSIIPEEEIAELRTIIEMKKNDLLTTESSIDVFVKRQVDRFKDLGESTLTPLVDAVSKKLDSSSDDDLRKILDDYKLKTTANFKEVQKFKFQEVFYVEEKEEKSKVNSQKYK